MQINRKTGKYEGRDAVPFTNQATVNGRELSDIATRNDSQYRRLTVKFVSGHKYVADLDRSYFEFHNVDFDDPVAAKKIADSKMSDAEVFRRAISDFSRQIPIVYERWHMSKEGSLCAAGHISGPKAESAPVTRVLPAELFSDL